MKILSALTIALLVCVAHPMLLIGIMLLLANFVQNSGPLILFVVSWMLISLLSAFLFSFYYSIKKDAFEKKAFLKSLFLTVLIAILSTGLLEQLFSVASLTNSTRESCGAFAILADGEMPFACIKDVFLMTFAADISIWITPICLSELFFVLKKRFWGY